MRCGNWQNDSAFDGVRGGLALANAVNNFSAPSAPATITVNLNGGTVNDTTVNPPASGRI